MNVMLAWMWFPRRRMRGRHNTVVPVLAVPVVLLMVLVVLVLRRCQPWICCLDVGWRRELCADSEEGTDDWTGSETTDGARA